MQPRSQVRVVTIGNLMVDSCRKSLRTTSLDSHSYAFANPVKRKRLRRGISDRETAKDLAMTAGRVDQVPTRLHPLTAKTGGLADRSLAAANPARSGTVSGSQTMTLRSLLPLPGGAAADDGERVRPGRFPAQSFH
jgi:hypothetical protein